VCERRGVRVRCHDPPHGEAVSSCLRSFHTASPRRWVNKPYSEVVPKIHRRFIAMDYVRAATTTGVECRPCLHPLKKSGLFEKDHTVIGHHVADGIAGRRGSVSSDPYW
jgi:hypothetical protein